MLPKCGGRDDLRQLSHYLAAFEAAGHAEQGATRILAIVTETAQSCSDCMTTRCHARLWGLSWGAEDLAADVGALRNRAAGAMPSLSAWRARSASWPPPPGVRAVDTVCVDLDAPEVLADESREAFHDGFVAKMAVHPRHIAAINLALTPDDSQLRWARAVIAAFAETPAAGALRLDGKMIDRPHLRLARRLLKED